MLVFWAVTSPKGNFGLARSWWFGDCSAILPAASCSPFLLTPSNLSNLCLHKQQHPPTPTTCLFSFLPPSFSLCLVPRKIMEEDCFWISDSEQRTAQTACQRNKQAKSPKSTSQVPSGDAWRLMMLESQCHLIQHFLPCFIQIHPNHPHPHHHDPHTHPTQTHGQCIRMRTFHEQSFQMGKRAKWQMSAKSINEGNRFCQYLDLQLLNWQ